jgi:CheY-like chemotaxis protein
MYPMRTPPPDVIVLDLNMPGESGLETLKRLKASARTTRDPTGRDERDDVPRRRRDGSGLGGG